jgi:hypothetical protein
MAYPPILSKHEWPFSPQSLPNCVCWLDAADTSSYTPSAHVTAWRNKVVYGSSPAYTSYDGDGVGLQPVDGISDMVNNLNILSFNSYIGYKLQFRLPPITYSQTSRTIFYLINTTSNYGLNYEDYYIRNGSGTDDNPRDNSFTFSIDLGLFFFNNNYVSDFQQSFTSLNPVNITNKTTIICITTSNGFVVDGSSIPTNFNSPITMAIGTSSSQRIGNANNSNDLFSPPINIGDFLIFDGTLTNIQRQQVEGYLANKWGIQSQLPATHPYYAANPTTMICRPNNRTFQPVDIAGCQMWLDAADATTIVGTASNVTGWKDKSGSGYSASKYSVDTGSITTSTAPNGLPTLLLTNNRMTISNVTFNNAQTIFIVCNFVGGAYLSLASQGTNPLIGGNLWYFMTANWNLYFCSPNFTVYDTAYGVPYPPPRSTVYPVNTWGILCVGYNLGTTLSHYTINGTSRISNLNTSTANTTGTNTGVYVINGISQGHGGTITIGEILHYNRSISVSERLQIESYLVQKWNLASSFPSGNTFPTTHPGYYLPAYSTVFTPKALGPALWLDAADPSTITISESTGGFASWADKSGFGNSALQNNLDSGVIAYFIEDKISYVSVNNTRIYISNFTWYNVFTQFIVARAFSAITTALTNVQNYGNIYYSLSTENAPLVTINTYNTSDSRYGGSLPGVVSNFVIFCIGYNRDVTLSHYTLNGVSGIGNLFPNIGPQSASSTTGYFQINGTSTPNDTGFTDFSEILHYNRSLSVAERQQVEGYLAWKWGTASTLPTTHPYAKFSP